MNDQIIRRKSDDMAKPMPQAAVTFEYEVHPLANIFPMMEDDQFDALVADILRHGIQTPITLYQGKILDGRNRYRAAREAGYKLTAKDFRDLPSDQDPKQFVVSANAQRRQLNQEQKRKFLAWLIRDNPTASDVIIASLAGCDKKTVKSVRDELKQKVEKALATWDDLDQTQQAEFVRARAERLQQLLVVAR